MNKKRAKGAVRVKRNIWLIATMGLLFLQMAFSRFDLWAVLVGVCMVFLAVAVKGMVPKGPIRLPVQGLIWLWFALSIQLLLPAYPLTESLATAAFGLLNLWFALILFYLLKPYHHFSDKRRMICFVAGSAWYSMFFLFLSQRPTGLYLHSLELVLYVAGAILIHLCVSFGLKSWISACLMIVFNSVLSQAVMKAPTGLLATGSIYNLMGYAYLFYVVFGVLYAAEHVLRQRLDAWGEID